MSLRVVLSSPRAGWGGSATVGLCLARGLSARGHEVVVFCKPDSAIHREMGDHFATEPILKGIDFPPRAIARGLAAFRRHGTQVALSLLHMDLRLTAVAGRLAGLPVVAHRAEPEPFSRLPHRRFLLHRLPHHWVTPSETNRRTMLASAPWLDEDAVTIIHNGVDPTRFDGVAPAELGVPEGGVAVGYVGRLVEEKGLGEVAAAWRSLAPARPELHLVLVGEGSFEAELRRRLEGLPRVRWLGYRRDVPAILAALDVALLPSWDESFGIAAVEAMAAGRPVVASSTGGLAEVVADGETGVLVPPRDADALARAVGRLAGDSGARERMGRAARERVRERYTEERMVDGYERVLRRVVREAGGG